MTGADSRSLDHLLTRHVGDHPGACTPGAVVLVERRGEVVARAAAGLAQLHDCGRPLRRPMDLSTRFDVASLTKVVATTAVLMRLVDTEGLSLDTRLVDLVPTLRGPDKAAVTLERLLAHDAGFAPWQPVYLHTRDRQAAVEWVAGRELLAEPGTAHVYSDLGFMLLGGALEHATGCRLDRLAHRLVFEPLGMAGTGYRPHVPAGADRRADEAGDAGAGASDAAGTAVGIAATSCGEAHEQRMIATGDPYPVEGDVADFDGWRQRTLVGEVNDGNAFHAFGGVAGHAGLFADADGLMRFGRALLAGSRGDDNPLASPPVVQRFLRPTRWPRQRLGWWSDPAGLDTGGRLVGHSGFTGTRVAISPQHEAVVILLANRQQLGPPAPDVTPLWRDLGHSVLGTGRPSG